LGDQLIDYGQIYFSSGSFVKKLSKNLEPKRCIRGFSPEIDYVFLIYILSFSLVAGRRVELPTSGL
tara:strand:+ start:342 stop:539 length:198 start_codon:yes stop_codon:yes gene_type:complete